MTTSNNNEEEYKFPNEEEFGSYESQQSDSISSYDAEGSASSVTQKVNEKPFVLNKRIIAVVVLALVFSLIFTFVRYKKNQATTPAAAPVVATKQQSPAPIVYSSSKTPELKSELGSLGGKVSENSNAISSLASKMNQVSADVKAVKNHQAELKPVIASVQGGVNQLLAAQQRKEEKKKQQKRIYDSTYFIRAMVPGRAWLVSRTGVTASVGVREKLPGYGMILKIDTDDGIVYTSSGRKIFYGKNDY